MNSPQEGAPPNFSAKVIQIVSQIPRGKVLSYGDVASLTGNPRLARFVSGTLQRAAQKDASFPWQRVISSKGTISTYRIGFGELQKQLLQDEGVEFSSKEIIDLDEYRRNNSEQYYLN